MPSCDNVPPTHGCSDQNSFPSGHEFGICVEATLGLRRAPGHAPHSPQQPLNLYLTQPHATPRPSVTLALEQPQGPRPCQPRGPLGARGPSPLCPTTLRVSGVKAPPQRRAHGVSGIKGWPAPPGTSAVAGGRAPLLLQPLTALSPSKRQSRTPTFVHLHTQGLHFSGFNVPTNLWDVFRAEGEPDPSRRAGWTQCLPSNQKNLTKDGLSLPRRVTGLPVLCRTFAGAGGQRRP